MLILLIEDEQTSLLQPIALARPAYAISCGGYRLIDWLRLLGGTIRGSVRAHLRELQHADYQVESADQLDGSDDVLVVNAAVVPSVAAFRQIEAIAQAGRACSVVSAGRLAAAMLTRSETPQPPISLRNVESLADRLKTLTAQEASLPLFQYPHDVVRYNMEILRENLEYRIRKGEYREIEDGVFAAPGVSLGPHCVTDTKAGPIVLDARATIGPFCFFRGPALIGAGAKLIEHASIKDAVSLGHTTKIGGEVEASVVEPFTNKQHHGFLGHSYLGSWVNLGAGTCNSDLKNTYGKVNMEYPDQRIATGMQFLGCMMGDYSKTAINTGIFTGKIVGVCSMLYGFITSNVPSFVNYARLFGQVTELPPEVMIASQERTFRRRSVQQRPCDIQLIHDMYELTREERQFGSEPLAL
jgi:glucose-1-phosphate thymidylyltransferase